MRETPWLGDEQRAVRDLAADIARDRIAPRPAEVDAIETYPARG